MSAHIWTQPQAALEEITATIEPALGDALVATTIEFDELTITVAAPTIARVLTHLRDEPSLLFRLE